MATATTTTVAPTRRISWKANDFRKEKSLPGEYNEKPVYEYPISETTAHDVHTVSPHTAAAVDLPTRISSSSDDNDDDVECQRDPGFRVRTNSWRNKFLEYTMFFLVFLVWMLLIVGVLLLTDTFFPMALRSYHKLQQMKAELSNTNFELEVLKGKMSVLYQSIGRIRAVTLQTVQKLRK